MFSFKSVGHFFAAAAHDVSAVGKFLSTHQAQIDKGLEVGVSILSTLDPALAPAAQLIERAAEGVLGEVLAVVAKLDDAAVQHGANVTFDVAAVTELKQLVALIEKLKPGTVSQAAAFKPTV